MSETDNVERREAIKDLLKLDEGELRQTIVSRLNRSRIDPPLNPQIDESPIDLLIESYNVSAAHTAEGEAFRSRFSLAVAELLAAAQIRREENADYLSWLLLLSQRFALPDTAAPIGGLLVKQELKDRNSVNGNLHRLALLAFSKLPQGMSMRDLWRDAIGDRRFTAASFAALAFQGVDLLFTFFGEFLRIHESDPSVLNLNAAISSLYRRYGRSLEPSQLTLKIWHATAQASDSSRAAVKVAIRIWDPETTLPPQPPADSRVLCYHAAVRLFRSGQIDEAKGVLGLLNEPQKTAYLLGLLYLSVESSVDRAEAKVNFLAAHGLSDAEVADVYQYLKAEDWAVSPEALKRSLLPLALLLQQHPKVLEVVVLTLATLTQESGNRERAEAWRQRR